jgi:hypothetical protein
MFGRKDFEFLPFESYGGQNMEQGVFYLFSNLQPKPITNEQCSAENFYPGFVLLLQLCHSAPVESPPPESRDGAPYTDARKALTYGDDPGPLGGHAWQPR